MGTQASIAMPSTFAHTFILVSENLLWTWPDLTDPVLVDHPKQQHVEISCRSPRSGSWQRFQPVFGVKCFQVSFNAASSNSPAAYGVSCQLLLMVIHAGFTLCVCFWDAGLPA